mmetsp:Transcript_17377/g.39663  ORF Transcript_17377/g.39663 Transcript_17377/m.39663 type:complete len:257 (-) Transcript_17377:213-983(-)
MNRGVPVVVPVPKNKSRPRFHKIPRLSRRIHHDACFFFARFLSRVPPSRCSNPAGPGWAQNQGQVVVLLRVDARGVVVPWVLESAATGTTTTLSCFASARALFGSVRAPHIYSTAGRGSFSAAAFRPRWVGSHASRVFSSPPAPGTASGVPAPLLGRFVPAPIRGERSASIEAMRCAVRVSIRQRERERKRFPRLPRPAPLRSKRHRSPVAAAGNRRCLSSAPASALRIPPARSNRPASVSSPTRSKPRNRSPVAT